MCKRVSKLAGLIMLLLGCALLGSSCSNSLEKSPQWAASLSGELRALGYRNWIIIAESSYPVHSRRGVRTVVVDAETPEILDYVVDYFDRSENVRPSFSTAHELTFVKNDNAPGIDEFRARLKKALHGHDVRQMDHRALSLLAESDSADFAVLVIKTNTALPYTNVFVELDSGYWDRDSEDKLRAAIKAKAKARDTTRNEVTQKTRPAGN